MSDRANAEDPLDKVVRSWASDRPGDRCPDEEGWFAFASGDLSRTEAEALREHLSGCPRCVELARDAHRFLAAMGELPVQARRSVPRFLALAIAASVLVAAGVVFLVLSRGSTEHEGLRGLAASLEAPTAPAGEIGVDRELVFRGGREEEWQASRDAAFEPYRRHDFRAACDSLVAHGARFPTDRDARFAAAFSCLKGERFEPAEELLAALATSEGVKQREAIDLLARLRAARSGSEP